MVDDPARHVLADADSERIFRTEIEPDYLEGLEPARGRPRAVLVGGQPGAGTMGLRRAAEGEFGRDRPLVVNDDDPRAYHPSYKALLRSDPLNAAVCTGPDTGRWIERLISSAQELGLNLVIEGTMRQAGVLEERSAALRSAGYRVEAKVLAVQPELSWLGVHQRCETMIARGGAPRLSTREAHDAAVEGMVDTLREAEASKLLDAIQIGLRGGRLIYENEVDGGAWRSPARAAEALAAARNARLSDREIALFEQDWARVVDQMEARSAPRVEIERARLEAASDLASLKGRAAAVEGTDARAQPAERGERRGQGPELALGASGAVPGARRARGPMMRSKPALQAVILPQAIAQAVAVAGSQERGAAPAARTRGLDPPGQEPSREQERARADQAATPREWLIPPRTGAELDPAEVQARARAAPYMRRQREGIADQARLIFGDAAVGASLVDAIERSPATSANLAQEVRTAPERFGRLAGERSSLVMRLVALAPAEDAARQAARDALPALAHAIEDYGRSLAAEVRRLGREHAAEQRSGQRGVAPPCSELIAALEAPAAEQTRMLSAPTLQAELRSLNAAIQERLSDGERRAIVTRNTDALSAALAVTAEQADQILRTVRLVQGAAEQARGRPRQRSQGVEREV